MLNIALRSSLIGGWIATVVVAVAASVAMSADLTTTALFLAIGVAPAIVTALLAANGPSPTVAEILYSVDPTDAHRH
jgi:hypothetical protein